MVSRRVNTPLVLLEAFVLLFVFSGGVQFVAASCARGTSHELASFHHLSAREADSSDGLQTFLGPEKLPTANDTNGVGYGQDGSIPAPVFGYVPSNGPLTWHQLYNGKFETCATGKFQSPIDITTDESMDKETQIELGRNRVQWYDDDFDIQFARAPGHDNATYLLQNIGTTLELSNLTVEAIDSETKHTELYQSFSTVNGTRYMIKQVHFHSPSEHKIDGVEYPLEAHIVHEDPKTNMVFVLSILFEPNANTTSTSDGFTEVFRLSPHLTRLGDQSGVTMSRLHLSTLERYIVNAEKWVYRGSFTTPPCSEGITWIVLSEPLRISVQDQVSMSHVLGGNSRFTQTRLGQPNVLQTSCRVNSG